MADEEKVAVLSDVCNMEQGSEQQIGDTVIQGMGYSIMEEVIIREEKF